ncbi:MAG: hypothetical protein E4G90_06360 [Gemmatimonadales bacterium]|nr:MAG: hypothetical protein E4G90_06360 [Gemmatimonadales bacterium]
MRTSTEMPYYRNNETSPLPFSEKDIEELVVKSLSPEERARFKHIVFHCIPDEHSYSPTEVRVYLKDEVGS